MNNLLEVLVDQLADLMSAENQLVEALPKMAKAVSSPTLAKLFESHLIETKEHVSRLKKLAQIFGQTLAQEPCQAMQGLLKEASAILSARYASPHLRDIMIVEIAQKIEHYEIAGYGNAVAIAEFLGQEECAALLSETLDEEKNADAGLTEVCQSEIFEASERADDEDTADAGFRI